MIYHSLLMGFVHARSIACIRCFNMLYCSQNNTSQLKVFSTQTIQRQKTEKIRWQFSLPIIIMNIYRRIFRHPLGHLKEITLKYFCWLQKSIPTPWGTAVITNGDSEAILIEVQKKNPTKNNLTKEEHEDVFLFSLRRLYYTCILFLKYTEIIHNYVQWFKWIVVSFKYIYNYTISRFYMNAVLYTEVFMIIMFKPI